MSFRRHSPSAIVPVPEDDPDFEPAIPSWDAHTSTLEDEGPNDFALLYKNGEVEGEVSDPSVREAHQYSTVELHRCKTTDLQTGGSDRWATRGRGAANRVHSPTWTTLQKPLWATTANGLPTTSWKASTR